MQPQVSKFISEFTGSAVKSPHGIAGQCVSVPSEFAVQQGWPELFGPGDGTALEIWNNGVVGYQKITNVPGPDGNAPVAGDFVFFGYGADGHVVLVESANLTTIMAFEQNDPTGSVAHTKAYSYFECLGWFHMPSNAPTPSEVLVEALRTTDVRSAASLTAPVTSVLQAGQTFEASGLVTGQEVNENGVNTNQWYHSSLGHFVWAGNCKRV